jgi:hypothetical protein
VRAAFRPEAPRRCVRLYPFSSTYHYLARPSSSLTDHTFKGIKVKESSVFTRKYCTEVTSLSTLSVFEVEIWCYRGGTSTPMWINRHAEDFTTLCIVQADLSPLAGSAQSKPGRSGKTYWTIVFSVEIHFGLTEFKARIKWVDSVSFHSNHFLRATDNTPSNTGQNALVSTNAYCCSIDPDTRRFPAGPLVSFTMKAGNEPKKTISMTMNLWPLPTSRGDRHLPPQSSCNSLCPKGLILRFPMRLPLFVPANHVARHLSPKASTRARGPRTQLPGVLPRALCQSRVASQVASNFLVLLRLPTPTLRGGVVLAVLETRSPPSGEITPLPLGPVPIPLACLRRSMALRRAVHFSMPLNLLLLCRRAQPSQR